MLAILNTYNFIVWMDMRTQDIVDRFVNKEIPNCDTLKDKKRQVDIKI